MQTPMTKLRDVTRGGKGDFHVQARHVPAQHGGPSVPHFRAAERLVCASSARPGRASPNPSYAGLRDLHAAPGVEPPTCLLRVGRHLRSATNGPRLEAAPPQRAQASPGPSRHRPGRPIARC